MRTHLLKSSFARAALPGHSDASLSPTLAHGWISELSYSEAQPGLTQLLLLPLLQQLGAQSRWQLWLTPPQKISRSWLKASGLPLNKMMQIANQPKAGTVAAMIKALQTGNYSVVLGWFPYDISENERRQLEEAASVGQALGLIMRPQTGGSLLDGQKNRLKIHSTLYH
ncbi:SOS-induced cell division inhibitor SulA [Mixta tenebrionis]|uniref:Cell division inhibitor SulA n=1 Tax=Mixta tenebrionis TaxID=2562439 RepID=A0A506VFB0_9GAMM|nr:MULTISPECIES: SOS-induced cell division inhibitor SulA [Mixta]QHM75999.1 Cell division inhibitor SulA [Mixta theicola]TPW44527.1 cell division inhibitor SulA [Mixta tenebrionis]